MEENRKKISAILYKYIEIICKEYGQYISGDVIDRLNVTSDIVQYNDRSISFFVRNGRLYLPSKAYSVFEDFKNYLNYGSDKNDYRKVDEYLDTNTTYSRYIDHVINCGMSAFDYYLENLLHEVMHLCGSGGDTPLEEGINELKTRELATKYNLKIAAYGYSKEVEIAKQLQQVLGKNVMDELTFIEASKRYDFLNEKLGAEYAQLYKKLSSEMITESSGYNSKIQNISNPYDKAKIYNNINYINSSSTISKFVSKFDDAYELSKLFLTEKDNDSFIEVCFDIRDNKCYESIVSKNLEEVKTLINKESDYDNYMESIIIPVVNNYAKCSPILSTEINDISDNIVNYKAVSTNNNLLVINNIDRTSAQRIDGIIKSTKPKYFNRNSDYIDKDNNKEYTKTMTLDTLQNGFTSVISLLFVLFIIFMVIVTIYIIVV